MDMKLVGFIILMCGGIVFGYMGIHGNYPECVDIIDTKCYKYYSNGGIFGGVNSKRVSCNVEYDYKYITYGGENCTYKYVKDFNISREPSN